jgi:hypothetical protein
VAVGVQGDTYGGVTKEFLHQFDVHTFAEWQGGALRPKDPCPISAPLCSGSSARRSCRSRSGRSRPHPLP